MRTAFAVLAYIVPTFAIAFVWHIVLFAEVYDELAIYRADLNVPMGFLTICLQGLVYGTVYPRLRLTGPVLLRGVKLAVAGALLSWTYVVLAVAAKHPMTSVADFIVIETVFSVVLWSIVGPSIAFAHDGLERRADGRLAGERQDFL